MRQTLQLLVLGLATLVSAAEPALAAEMDWPQFRGPQRDAVSGETGLLHSWPDHGLPVIWKTALGEGYSGISAVKGRLYTMFGEGQDEFLVSLDAETGKELWRHRVGPKWVDRWGNGPRSTPTVADGAVYAVGSKGNLHACAASNGKPLWTRDLVKEFGAEPPTWGVSASTQIEGDSLLLNVGGKKGSSVVAFDRKSGKELWRSQEGNAGYAAPLTVTIGGQAQVVFLTASSLIALDPKAGTLRWRVPWTTSYDVNASTPVFIAPDKIFISTGYDVGSALYRISADEATKPELVWKSREMKNKFSSSVYHDGFLYGFDEKTLKCIDAESGETRWRGRGFGHGSLVYADGHLVLLGDEGTLALVEATPEEYRLKSRMQLFEGKTWTVPTLYGGRLFARDEKQIVSLNISTATK